MKTVRLMGMFFLIGGVLFLAACSGTGNVNQESRSPVDPDSQVEATQAVTLEAVPTTVPQETQEAMLPSTGVEFDQMFIDMMVPHHQSAVEMALIARERARHPEILQLAKNVINSQQQEIDQMLSWREAWYNSRQTPPMSQMPMLTGMEGMSEGMHGMDMQAEVEALRNAPEPFDLAFIDAMIPHHQQAIEAAKLALEQAQHPEIKEMAQKIIEDQQREIQELESLRAELNAETAATATP